MARRLGGAEVAAQIGGQSLLRAEALAARGVTPTLALLRLGERPDDLAYERGAVKRAEAAGVAVRRFVLPADAPQDDVLRAVEEINRDRTIHGALLFRPMPKQIDETAVFAALLPEKDIDGVTEGSLAGVFTGRRRGFPPCTAEACLRLLDYYKISIEGKRAVVVGRSLVIGRPVAMMLLSRNATVTLCHTKTQDLPAVCRGAEILIAAAGRAGMLGADCFAQGQIVLDVGVNFTPEGKMTGDADFAAADAVADAVTPVPGGIGAVTSAVLAAHVIEAAERSLNGE